VRTHITLVILLNTSNSIEERTTSATYQSTCSEERYHSQDTSDHIRIEANQALLRYLPKDRDSLVAELIGITRSRKDRKARSAHYLHTINK